MLSTEVIRETEQRFAERTPVREDRAAKIRSGAILEADTPERVRERVQRVARMIIETEGTGTTPAGQPSASTQAALERIIGRNDLMSVRFLELATRVARTVGRIHVRGPDGSALGFGTGFLVSPRLLLTNNHVLENATVAGASRVEFDFQEGVDGKLLTSIVLALDPATFYVTDKGLDFSLVALKGDVRKIAGFGWNGLSSAEGKVIAGEYVSIIQHPGGEKKQIAIRENRIVDVLESFLHYHTDTSPGSSGSPVFNDQWEIVALHHSGVPSKDAQGRLLTKDGKVWTKSMGEHQIHWVANEGVRISRILKHVAGLSLGAAQVNLRRELLESDPGWRPGVPAAHEAMVGVGAGEAIGDGTTYTVPIQLRIDLGRLATGIVPPPVAGVASPADGDGLPPVESFTATPRPEVTRALQELTAGTGKGNGNGNGSVHGNGADVTESAEEWLLGGGF